MLYSLRRFEEDEVAQERLKIIEFYEEYGEKATNQALGISVGSPTGIPPRFGVTV